MNQIVYALTSGGRDIYSAMTRVSVASVRITNPEAKIVIVCDSVSAKNMDRIGDPLCNEVDEWIICNPSSDDSAFRSRFVKTNVRNVVGGRFLFLDGDTLVRENLAELFSLPCDIAGCPNHSKDRFEDQMWEGAEDALLKMNWKVRDDVYINSGVVFFNDTPTSKVFGATWHKKWQDFYAHTGNHRDQPAFNNVIYETKAKLLVLPHRYNAQIKKESRVASGAAIWHFYAAQDDAPITAFEALVNRLLKGTELTRSHVELIVRHNHPWRRESWTDDLAASWVSRKGCFDWEDYLWFQGHRARSLRRRIARRLRRSLLSRVFNALVVS